MSTFYTLSANRIDGSKQSMKDYENYVVLIVNTASKCGFTPQFEGLEKLYQKYKDKNFVVLGFPCNQFANQDPSSNTEIHEFCSLNYGVQFPMFEKVEVNGPNTHPIFEFLKANARGLLGKKIRWNFTKFLIDRQGEVVHRFAPQTAVDAIEKELLNYL